ncbi:hypothetical protein HY045_00290 [Candidatus Woesebacteria bacterium]|nr:hypothetical protein [Candidatus Woesebacteria bacterium]
MELQIHFFRQGHFGQLTPSNIIDYIVPEYQKHPIDDIVPAWMPLDNQNYRLDTSDSGIVHWWNYIAITPSVRGYSSHPTGSRRDWQYLLQLATRDPKESNQLLVKNKALFYIDQFGIGYRENSIASYPKVLLSDPKIMTEGESRRDLAWYKISEDYTSPIVFPNNSAPVLVIGDNEGYKTIIRTISMQNLNTRLLIPINGPTKIDDLSLSDLRIYKAVVLYRFTSGSWTKLERYVENGGLLIINAAEDNNDFKTNLPNIFPFNKINVATIKGRLNLEKKSDSELLNNVNLNNFSPYLYNGPDWKIEYGNIADLRKSATAIITEKNKVFLAENKVGKGRVIWSGLNMPYHTVINENYDESVLFANFFKRAIDAKSLDPNYTITKFEPTDISVETKNTTGILYKENYHSGWQASVNGKAVKALVAGLDFIYVPVPLNLQSQHIKVELSFKGGFDTWGTFFLTVISIIINVFYLVTPKYFAKTFKYLFRIFTKPFGNWLYSE